MGDRMTGAVTSLPASLPGRDLRMHIPLTLLLIASALLSACGSRPESPFVQEPSPDLAVTTLEQPDIDLVARAIQLQGTIQLGCELSEQKPMPVPVAKLVATIRDQHRSRGYDLDALVQVKNAPPPELLGKRNSAELETFEKTDIMHWHVATVAFHRMSQTESLRLFRDAADRSHDADVRAFAARQIPGIASTLRLIEQVEKELP